jgi:putative CocE/NonD family hydrolase
VRLYVINEGWRDEQEWPPARAEYTPFFIHGAGRAQSLEGDGHLSRDQPATEPPDVFLSNPVNPAPTIGAAGIWDQRAVERRTDVLVYTSAPLTEPLEVTGPVKVVLWASSSAPDTDFTAKLVDVTPGGQARNVCEGILRTRYRDSHAEPRLLEPGVPARMEIDLLVTSTLFPAGHQLRLEIAGANFPRFDRNPNTGEPAGAATSLCPALQTVYHDTDHPTHILLPVIPRGH